jgi:hypothetical protein
VRHGEKISSVPANPTISPASCQAVTRCWCRMARASIIVHSGVVALMMPAVAELTDCSATANSRYGTALANSAAITMSAQSRVERGMASRRTAVTGNSTAAPSASRASVTSSGENPRMASLIHRNDDPQISASRPSRARAECLTLPRCPAGPPLRPSRDRVPRPDWPGRPRARPACGGHYPR